MSKSFTDLQRQQIDASLIFSGRHLFSRFGLQKTNIGTITSSVGISQGAFYLFYESKEALFHEIVTRDESIFKKNLMAELEPHMNEPASCLRLLLDKGLTFVSDHPMMLQLMDSDTMTRLSRKINPDRLERHFSQDTDAVKPLLDHWLKNGLIRSVDPVAFSGVLRSLFLLCIHQKEIGEEHFTATLSLLTELIGLGLVNQEAISCLP